MTTPAAPQFPVYPAGTSPAPPRRARGAELPAGYPEAATPYERLPRTLAGYTWWRLALAILIAIAVFGVGQVLVLVPMMIGDPSGLLGLEQRLASLDALDVPMLVVALASLAFIIPGVWFGMWVMRLRPAWIVSSVVGRLRWRWMLRCGLYAVVMIVVSIGASIGVGLLAGDELTPDWTPLSRLWLPLLVIVLLVPFQAAAEEYAFRGVMVQALGSWLPRRWWARVVIALVTTGLFVSGHMYELWGLLDVGIFGLAALWLVLRTGGLEASIALHVVNNVVVFGLMASGVWGTTVQSADGGSLIGVLISAVTTIGYCIAVELTARRWRIARTSSWPEVGSTPAPALPQPVTLVPVALVTADGVVDGLVGSGGAGGGRGHVYPPER